MLKATENLTKLKSETNFLIHYQNLEQFWLSFIINCFFLKKKKSDMYDVCYLR